MSAHLPKKACRRLFRLAFEQYSRIKHWGEKQDFINSRKNKVVYFYMAVSYNNENLKITDTCNNLSESHEHNIKPIKPNIKMINVV